MAFRCSVTSGRALKLCSLSLLLVLLAPQSLWQVADARQIESALDETTVEQEVTEQTEFEAGVPSTDDNVLANGMWHEGVEQYFPDQPEVMWRAAVGQIRMVEGRLSHFEPPSAEYTEYCVLTPNHENELKFAQFHESISPSDGQCGIANRFKLKRAGKKVWNIQHTDGRFIFLHYGIHVWWMGSSHTPTKFQIFHRRDGTEVAFYSPEHKCVMKMENDNWGRCRPYNKNAVDEYRFWFAGWKLGARDNWKATLSYRTVWEIDGCLIPDDSTMSVSKSLTVGKSTNREHSHTLGISAGAEGSAGKDGPSLSASFSYEGSVSFAEAFEEEQTIEIPGDVAPGQIMLVQQLMGVWGPTQLRTSKIKYSCKNCETDKEEACTHGTQYFHVTVK